MNLAILFTFVFFGLNLLLSWWFLFKKIPPRNSIIGFRTPKSTKNDENWYFANKQYAKYTGILSILYVFAFILFLILRSNFTLDQQESILGYGILVSYMIIILLIIIIISYQLRKFERRT